VISYVDTAYVGDILSDDGSTINNS